MSTLIPVLIILSVFFGLGYLIDRYYNSLPWEERRKLNHYFSDREKERQLRKYKRRSNRHYFWNEFLKNAKGPCDI